MMLSVCLSVCVCVFFVLRMNKNPKLELMYGTETSSGEEIHNLQIHH
jgi:hypothetical protein